MKKRFLLLITGCLFIATGVSYSQVGIGTEIPDESAILDVTSTNKGVLLPRVELTSTDMDLDGVSGQQAGLLVYNTGGTLSVGYYFWDGKEWVRIDNSTAVAPAIAGLICSSVTLSPAGYRTGVPYTGNLIVPYTDGNGGSYPAGTPVTEHGLTFTLRAGKLEYGNGELVFSVEGTPDTNSEIALSLTQTQIPFLQSGHACTANIVNITDESVADVADAAFFGPLVLTTANDT